MENSETHYVHVAYHRLTDLLKNYTSVPEVSTLNSEEISKINSFMASFCNSMEQTDFRNFPFWGSKNGLRCKTIGVTQGTSIQEIQNGWNEFYKYVDQAKIELERYLKKNFSENEEIKNFQKSGNSIFGNEIERKQFAQALDDMLNENLSEEEKLSLPENMAVSEIKKYFSPQGSLNQYLMNYALNNKVLNLQIQGESLQNLNDSFNETFIENLENPFFDENQCIQNVNQMPDSDICAKLDSIKNALQKTPTGKENTTDFEFYKKKFEELKIDKNDSPEEISEKNKQIEILCRNIKNDLQQSLTERFLTWQQEKIAKARSEYLANLYTKIDLFIKFEKLIQEIVGDEIFLLWSTDLEKFQDSGFNLLKKYANILEKDESLQELAEMIGRSNAEQQLYQKELREKAELKEEFHPKVAYRGQISGLRLGGDISSALPSELALLRNPETELYFAQKFAEKKLLSYAYINKIQTWTNVYGQEEVEVPIDEEGKGPVIICVDTSGSMEGLPEKIAKTITFALAKICLSQNRKCYLISFSTEIEVLDLSEFKKSDGLAKLMDFLGMSFYGGTDSTEALNHAITLLNQNSWKSSDVLMVSDFCMEAPSKELKEKIEECKKNRTRFFSLVIRAYGDISNKKVIKCFDENWRYNSKAKDSMRHLVRKVLNKF